ncbi:HAUS augmin-like complex subunit 6 N-terminus-domain-containing protein [Apiosordaria backusii]|uniref:HAUS augmin-like complex subunit 6 N-terminus-domain-containing protein n=1 Tax=Apiosordaria backusii TaxID=314023 RepID=A0AA40K3S2_9PEZI|nr:HAUS augmin-like complex subunit 6 N-terminus-domain-containing protein [Apiosordaria backusii]
MANLTSTTSIVTRTRSTRAPSHLSKPPASTTLNSIRGTTPAAPPPQQPSASLPAVASPTTISNVSLFLTNLRLLDLDLQPDWPDISTSTFNTKDAGGQKKRIQCVEWALYHLFALYDRDETRNKLLPFFPPNDQVQSLNLRAALLRQLEQAKKNGILGRDAVVRKTMLDECKGERLEEVLAVFSSVVLKKIVAEGQLNSRDPIPPALAQTLALENMGYSGDKGELTVLVLAHRVSLQRTLDKKNKSRERFKEFSVLLAGKEIDIARRRRQQQDQEEDQEGVSEQVRRDVWRTVRNNWTGNERWMGTLLNGDSEAQKDGVLSAPFDRVWRRVQSDRLAELDEKSPGLLEQLDDRVRSQNERLEKWQGFRQRMFGKTGVESTTRQSGAQERQRGIDLGFRGHETLHVGRTSPKKLASTRPSNFDHEYEKLISNLKAELGNIAPSAPRIPSFFQQAPATVPPLDLAGVVESESEEISDISDHEPTPIAARPSPPRRNPIKLEPVFEPVLRKAQSFYNDAIDLNEIPTTPSRLRRSATIQSQSPSPRRREPTHTPTPTRSPQRRLSSPPKPTLTPTRNAVLPPPQPSPEFPSSPDDLSPSPTQEMADQILASVNNASPSPIKRHRHTLSLAERTRLSMARRTSHANLRVSAEDDDLLLDSPAPEPRKQLPPPSIVPTPPSPETGSNAYEDLVSRTRRSMANFEAVKQKAQIERRRSLRQSKAPPATPQHQGGRPRSGYFSSLDEEGEDGYQDEGNTTLLIAEELINEGKEDDYEAVFMSRPKIATSPVGTPVMRGRNWATTDF